MIMDVVNTKDELLKDLMLAFAFSLILAFCLAVAIGLATSYCVALMFCLVLAYCLAGRRGSLNRG